MATVTNINDVQVGDTLTSAQIYEAASGSKPGIQENKSRKDLEYPLNNPDEYKGRLVFNVMKEPETDLGNISEAATSFAKSIGDGLKNALGTNNPDEVAKAVKSHKGEVNVPIIKQVLAILFLPNRNAIITTIYSRKGEINVPPFFSVAPV